jgi:very-short-patch-repair endonuclease
LRAGRLGAKFRRQHPIGECIVDFACVKLSLVIEVDGRSHNETGEHDLVRQQWLESQGWRVLRLQNNEVLRNLDQAASSINDLVESLQSE